MPEPPRILQLIKNYQGRQSLQQERVSLDSVPNSGFISFGEECVQINAGDTITFGAPARFAVQSPHTQPTPEEIYKAAQMIRGWGKKPVVLLRSADGFTKEHEAPENFTPVIALPRVVAIDGIAVQGPADPLDMSSMVTIEKREFHYSGMDQATGLPLYVEKAQPLPPATKRQPKPAKRKLEV